jgi:Rrf2 family nitric oxide-sensitive transcriptional repressor
MRLTRFTDNALRCLIYLAAEPERSATVTEIATAMRMSPDHLLKVVKRLVVLGYVRTLRGRKGGVRLALPAATIRVADVVRATEDNLALMPCFGATTMLCPLGPSCTLAHGMHEALHAFFHVLQRYSIADLVAQSPQFRAHAVALATTSPGG